VGRIAHRHKHNDKNKEKKMRRITTLLILAAVATLTLGGCNRRQTIPEDTLAAILRDAYLTNAYLGNQYMVIDSLQIYEPILSRYGYSQSDFQYTIGNFSRRKSAKLGMVLRSAEDQLREQAEMYEKLVVVLDTIRDVAMRKYNRTIYSDTLIKVRKRADTTRLHIIIEPIYPGAYDISYRSECDEDLTRYKRYGSIYFEGRTDSMRYSLHEYTLYEKNNIRRTITADTLCQRLVLSLGGTTNRKERAPKPNVTIRDLEVRYTPTEEMAIDSLFTDYVVINIFDDEFLFFADTLSIDTQPLDAQNQLAPAADTTGVR
jgi:hypothetical protein